MHLELHASDLHHFLLVGLVFLGGLLVGGGLGLQVQGLLAFGFFVLFGGLVGREPFVPLGFEDFEFHFFEEEKWDAVFFAVGQFHQDTFAGEGTGFGFLGKDPVIELGVVCERFLFEVFDDSRDHSAVDFGEVFEGSVVDVEFSSAALEGDVFAVESDDFAEDGHSIFEAPGVFFGGGFELSFAFLDQEEFLVGFGEFGDVDGQQFAAFDGLVEFHDDVFLVSGDKGSVDFDVAGLVGPFPTEACTAGQADGKQREKQRCRFHWTSSLSTLYAGCALDASYARCVLNGYLLRSRFNQLGNYQAPQSQDH